MAQVTVGVDFGNWRIRAAICRDPGSLNVEVIDIANGVDNIPSMVYYNAEGIWLGQRALTESVGNPCNVIYDIKSMLGKRYVEVMHRNVEHWPFEVIDDDGTKIVVHERGRTLLTPTQVLGHLLLKVRKSLAVYLPTDYQPQVVLSVPPHFRTCQRKAIAVAAVLAGFSNSYLVNDISVAAYAYMLNDHLQDGHKALIYQTGHNSICAAVVSIEASKCIVKAIGTNNTVGGSQIIKAVMEHILLKDPRDDKVDLRGDKHVMARLRREAEKIIQELGHSQSIIFYYSTIYLVSNDELEITQNTYLALVKAIFTENMLISPIEEALYSADISKLDIDTVRFIGMPSKILYICDTVRDFFDGKPRFVRSYRPDMDTTFGAALYASRMLSPNNSSDFKDVKEPCIKVETYGGNITDINPRNSVLPSVTEKVLDLEIDGHTVVMDIYEGGDFDTTLRFHQNHVISDPVGIVTEKVTFEVGYDGILCVHVNCQCSR